MWGIGMWISVVGPSLARVVVSCARQLDELLRGTVIISIKLYIVDQSNWEKGGPVGRGALAA